MSYTANIVGNADGMVGRRSVIAADKVISASENALRIVGITALAALGVACGIDGMAAAGSKDGSGEHANESDDAGSLHFG